MHRYYFIRFILLLLCFSASGLTTTNAANNPVNNDKLNIVIHISSGLASSHQAALNYTQIIRDKHGSRANIIIVANGPGIAFANKNNKFKHSIKRLHNDNIHTFACNNTIQHLINNNKKIPIVEEVQIVPFGILKVVELQNKGYLYLRP